MPKLRDTGLVPLQEGVDARPGMGVPGEGLLEQKGSSGTPVGGGGLSTLLHGHRQKQEPKNARNKTPQETNLFGKMSQKKHQSYKHRTHQPPPLPLLAITSPSVVD